MFQRTGQDRQHGGILPMFAEDGNELQAGAPRAGMDGQEGLQALDGFVASTERRECVSCEQGGILCLCGFTGGTFTCLQGVFGGTAFEMKPGLVKGKIRSLRREFPRPVETGKGICLPVELMGGECAVMPGVGEIRCLGNQFGQEVFRLLRGATLQGGNSTAQTAT